MQNEDCHSHISYRFPQNSMTFPLKYQFSMTSEKDKNLWFFHDGFKFQEFPWPWEPWDNCVLETWSWFEMISPGPLNSIYTMPAYATEVEITLTHMTEKLVETNVCLSITFLYSQIHFGQIHFGTLLQHHSGRQAFRMAMLAAVPWGLVTVSNRTAI